MAADPHRQRPRDPLRAGSTLLPPAMSGRAKDVLPLTLATYVIVLGLLLLLDSTGAVSIGVSGAVGSAFGLAFIALGLLAIMAAWRVRRFTRQFRRAVGHVRS